MIELAGTVPITVIVDEDSAKVDRVIVWDELVSELHCEDAPGGAKERRALQITEGAMWPAWEFGA